MDKATGLLPVGDSHRQRTPIGNPTPILPWHILLPVGDNHEFGQNTPLLSPKYPYNRQNTPYYRQNNPPLSAHLFKYLPNEHVPC